MVIWTVWHKWTQDVCVLFNLRILVVFAFTSNANDIYIVPCVKAMRYVIDNRGDGEPYVFMATRKHTQWECCSLSLSLNSMNLTHDWRRTDSGASHASPHDTCILCRCAACECELPRRRWIKLWLFHSDTKLLLLRQILPFVCRIAPSPARHWSFSLAECAATESTTWFPTIVQRVWVMVFDRLSAGCDLNMKYSYNISSIN